MRNNGYNHHQQQHHHHHLQQHKGTFLPTLCSRPSMMKDVHVPTNNPFNKAHSSSARRSEDPTLSPKVGCMGQVKKKNIQHQNNYKLGMVFPTSTTSSTNSTSTASNPNSTAVGFGHSHSSSNFSYSKFLRLFSSKTLLASTQPVQSAGATKCSTTTTTVSCRKSGPHHHHHQQSRLRSRSCEDGVITTGFGSPINVADLDPPLPVIIKKNTTTSSLPNCDDNNKNSSLWKRRSGGAALKGLQIQQVHITIPNKPTISV